MDINELLKRNIPFLFGFELSDRQIEALASHAQLESYPLGKTVIRQGETVDALHLISTGKVAVFVKHERDQPPTRVSELRPGQAFGETAVIEEGVATATVRAEEKTTLYKLSHDAFLQVFNQDPDLKEKLNAYLKFKKTRP